MISLIPKEYFKSSEQNEVHTGDLLPGLFSSYCCMSVTMPCPPHAPSWPLLVPHLGSPYQLCLGYGASREVKRCECFPVVLNFLFSWHRKLHDLFCIAQKASVSTTSKYTICTSVPSVCLKLGEKKYKAHQF